VGRDKSFHKIGLSKALAKNKTNWWFWKIARERERLRERLGIQGRVRKEINLPLST
jgi:hypothetical protein